MYLSHRGVISVQHMLYGRIAECVEESDIVIKKPSFGSLELADLLKKCGFDEVIFLLRLKFFSQFSIIRSVPRSTTSELGGTGLVIVDPAAVVAFSPTLTAYAVRQDRGVCRGKRYCYKKVFFRLA